jgi:hypothetical protein
LLLLAGGQSTVNAVHGRYATLEAGRGWPADTAANRAELVTALPPADARLARDWIEERNTHIADGPDTLATLDTHYFTQETLAPADTLARRLDGWPWHADMVHFQLGYADFERAAPHDDAYVRNALKAAGITKGTQVLRDFSADAGPVLECRESEIRAGLTDFGVLVCECVRQQANADIAILNSGMFRADALLPSRLRERDIMDAFASYDAPDAIWVLDGVADKLVDQLLADNRNRAGEGAYPQVSDRRAGTGLPCRLAIAGYVLTTGTLDPAYLAVFAHHRNMTVADAAKSLASEPVQRFSVIEALNVHLGSVAYPSVAALNARRDDASEFIFLANKVSRAFQASLGRRRLPHARWNAAFRAMLASEAPVADTALQQARDALRQHLRAVPGPLRALREKIVNHRARFADRLDYHAIFDAAVGRVGR